MTDVADETEKRLQFKISQSTEAPQVLQYMLLSGNHVSWKSHQMYLRLQKEMDDESAKKFSCFIFFESVFKAALLHEYFVLRDFLPEGCRELF